MIAQGIEVIAFNAPEEDGEPQTSLGVFKWVQLTYNFLNISPDGDTLLVMDSNTGFWHPPKRTPIPETAKAGVNFLAGSWYTVSPDEKVRRFSDYTLSVVETFPWDKYDLPLAWPDPNQDGWYIDAWNGFYESREDALREALYWTADEATRHLKYGEGVKSMEDM